MTKLGDWIDNTDGLQYAYDAYGRLTRTWSSGNSEESYTTYDLLGRVSTQSTASGQSVAYVYDEWNRVAQMTVNGETVSYTYDSYGNLSTQHRPPEPGDDLPL